MTDSNSSSNFSNKSSNLEKPPKASFWSTIPFNSASDFLAASLLITNWTYPLYHLEDLPAKIPIPSFKQAMDWSTSKYFILLLPLSATIAYYQTVHSSPNPKTLLYPVKIPQGANPQKVSKVANVFGKVKGAVSQVMLLAASALLVKGVNMDRNTRESWLYKVIIGFVLVHLAMYGAAHVALRR